MSFDSADRTPLLFRNARVLTLAAGGAHTPRRGAALRELGVIAQGEVLVAEGRIAAVGERVAAPEDARVIDALGRVLMPGFVDCHTHACWAGERFGEWERLMRGESYEDILRGGGAIHATARAVREATRNQLSAGLRARLEEALRGGTTTIEVKSGYGLTVEAELKMLRAIQRAAGEWPGTVVPTALLGHAFEGKLDDYVRFVTRDLLPEIVREFPGVAVDAFCESGAWTLEACVRLFEKARKRHPIRVHADWRKSSGMIPEAVRMHALSVDHLEESTRADLELLAGSGAFGVVLPATAFHAGGRFASAAFFVDRGGALALATNCNPGTAPTLSMPLVIALAVRFCGLSPEEAIAASTVNPAVLLGFTDRGTVEAGKRADLILLHHRDERQLAHEFGGNPVALVVCGGRLLPVSPAG
ncbi:MAG: imidazolonepropionase [Opitutaceae bacterium]|jgi:imidazolonepropionase|nr:imidazolonepropionase [Opitutaceae bacterium]